MLTTASAACRHRASGTFLHDDTPAPSGLSACGLSSALFAWHGLIASASFRLSSSRSPSAWHGHGTAMKMLLCRPVSANAQIQLNRSPDIRDDLWKKDETPAGRPTGRSQLLWQWPSTGVAPIAGTACWLHVCFSFVFFGFSGAKFPSQKIHSPSLY